MTIDHRIDTQTAHPEDDLSVCRLSKDPTRYHLVETADQLPKFETVPQITVFGPPNCPNCVRTMNQLAAKGIAAQKVDLEPETDEYEIITQQLNLREAPIVMLHSEPEDPTAIVSYWSKHRPDLLRRLTRLCADL